MVSSTGALSLEQVPDRMVVIGAGVIGLELVRWGRGRKGSGGRRKEEEGAREEGREQLGKKDWEREGETEKEKKECHIYGMIFLL